MIIYGILRRHKNQYFLFGRYLKDKMILSTKWQLKHHNNKNMRMLVKRYESKLTVHFQRMKAASVASRSFGGTMTYHCFKFVGVTNWSWFTLSSFDNLMCSGSVKVNPASFSTPLLNVAETITFCRLPKLPSFTKCSCTMLTNSIREISEIKPILNYVKLKFNACIVDST